MSKKNNPFQLFGVVPGKYKDEDLKKTYLELVKKYTPEQYPDKFEEVRQAYNTLKNARSPYELLAVAPVKMNTAVRTPTEALNELEKGLGIEKKKIEYKRTSLLKRLEDINDDTGN